jgi:hypothetical protein
MGIEDQVIEELQLDLLEFVVGNIEMRKQLLPLTTKNEVSMLIYNLYKSAKYVNLLSGNNYKNIVVKLIEQIKE